MKKLLVALVVLVIFGYGLFESRRLIEGPTLSIDTPQGGSATSSAIVTITGRVENISFLTINGKTASADEQGLFVYRYSPPTGYTIATAVATDRFGRRVEKRVEFNVLTYCPSRII